MNHDELNQMSYRQLVERHVAAYQARTDCKNLAKHVRRAMALVFSGTMV